MWFNVVNVRDIWQCMVKVHDGCFSFVNFCFLNLYFLGAVVEKEKMDNLSIPIKVQSEKRKNKDAMFPNDNN